MTRIHSPAHSGWTLRDDVLPALGISVTRAAEQLGVSRITLSRMLHGRAALTPDMAARLEVWLGKSRGGDARVWLTEQANYDLWHAQQKLRVQRVKIRPAVQA